MPDNNTAERAMRSVAIGRKNYLFVGSRTGGRAAAIAYTLIETAKLNGINPQTWLADKSVWGKGTSGLQLLCATKP